MTTKTKVIEKWEAAYDADGEAPARTKTLTGLAADLVSFEDLGIGKLPALVGRALEVYAYGFTEVEPTAADRKAKADERAGRAVAEERADDAEAAAALIAKGGNLADLAAVLAKSTTVLDADTEAEDAARVYRAVVAANEGRLRYLLGLIGGTERAAFLKVLDGAWSTFVVVTPTPSTTLGQLAEAEALSAAGREVIGRLLLAAEHANTSTGMTPLDTKAIRNALREDWDVLPTLARIREAAEASAANSPAARRADEEARSAEAARADAIKYATENALARRAGLSQQNPDEVLVGAATN